MTYLRKTANSTLNVIHRPFAKRWFLNATRSGNDVMIAFGSGGTTHSGWICTDIGWRSKYYLDATEPWPVRDGSIAKVYSDNVIEHFSYSVAVTALKHAFRAMSHGARIRIVTPDAHRTAEIYLNEPELREALLERHRSVGYEVNSATDVLRIAFCEAGHHLGYPWDQASLTKVLSLAGFDEIARCKVSESTDSALQNLEQRSTGIAGEVMLVLEAVKRN